MHWSCNWGVANGEKTQSQQEHLKTDEMLYWFLLSGFCWSVRPHFLQEFGASHTGWIPQKTCLSPIMLCCCCCRRRGWRDQLSSSFSPRYVLRSFLAYFLTCPEFLSSSSSIPLIINVCIQKYHKIQPGACIFVIIYFTFMPKGDVKPQNIDNLGIWGCYFTQSCCIFPSVHICASIIV